MSATLTTKGLSQKAGHDSDQLVEIHGSLFTATCSSDTCAWTQPNTSHEPCVPTLPVDPQRADMNMLTIPSDFARCPDCITAKLRPGIVWFSEQMPLYQLARTEMWLDSVPRVDLMLVMFPAAEYIYRAREKGAYVAHFNWERDEDHMQPSDSPGMWQ